MADGPLAERAAVLARRLAALLADDTVGPLAARAAAELPVEHDPYPTGLAVHRLARLVRRHRLSGFETDLLVLAALPGEHEDLATVLAALHPTHEPAAWTGLAADLLLTRADERGRLVGALLAGPLVTDGLLRLGPGPFGHRTLRLPPGLWETLHGFDAWPPEVTARPLTAPVGLDGWLDSPAVARGIAAATDPAATVHLVCSDPADGLARAAALVTRAGRRPLALDTGPAGRADLAAVAVLAALRDDVLVVAVGPARPGETSTADRTAWLADVAAPVVVVAPPGVGVDAGDRVVVEVPVPPLTPGERRALWQALLPHDPSAARRLAAVHRVEPAAAARAVADADALAGLGGLGGAPVDDREVGARLRRRAGADLPPGGRLVRPTAGWADLVLPADQRAALVAAAGRLRRGPTVLDDWSMAAGRPGAAGVRLLFTGPPGTGKTLAAEVLAGELGLDLLVVDLAALVSRWLGETEKNLAAVFDAAEGTQAVLFFDEADALFARRTEVGDAHDRWANLETSYLLGRLERAEGVTVLATNLRANLDEAFLRRLEFVVEFEEPGADDRARLWDLCLPAGAPRAGDVRLEQLAELYPVTGAVIRSAALAAAFLAADDEGSAVRPAAIHQGHLVEAVRREYRKAGRSFPGAPRTLTAAPA